MWAPFGASGASGATGYLKHSEEVARVKQVLLKVLVALGTPRRHGCWTEPMLDRLDRQHVRGSVPQRPEARLGGRYAHAHSPGRGGVERGT
jgi:hypothetical protein